MTHLERIERAQDLLARINLKRPVWIDCTGRFRMGRSADMIEMLETLGYSTRA